MRRLLALALLSCGGYHEAAPVDVPRAVAGTPCLRAGAASCDVELRCALVCLEDDGVWEKSRCSGGCGGLGLSTPATPSDGGR